MLRFVKFHSFVIIIQIFIKLHEFFPRSSPEEEIFINIPQATDKDIVLDDQDSSPTYPPPVETESYPPPESLTLS